MDTHILTPMSRLIFWHVERFIKGEEIVRKQSMISQNKRVNWH